VNITIIVETVLVILFATLLVVSVLLFKKLKKTESRAKEAASRELDIMNENKMLDRLNRTKTSFFQNMSHDFKTPLVVVSMNLINALDILDFYDEVDKDSLRESIGTAHGEIMRLSRIVDGALKHATLYNNRHAAESIDLNVLLQGMADSYGAFLRRNKNIITLSIPEVLPQVYGNTDMLVNVLSNLITNANRYTKKGEISINAEVISVKKVPGGEKSFVSVCVSDTGMGIKPEILKNIFKRGESETSTGLGLHICKAAVETYGGTINVDTKEGAGTKITFTVPVFAEKKDRIKKEE